MKRYQLSYYTDELRANSVEISWEQGLRNFKAYYQGEIFFESPTLGNLKSGVTVFHEKLGNVFIRFCTHPIGYEVKIGDRYLENSRIPAKESLQSISAVWIFIGVISTLGSLGFLMTPDLYFGLIETLVFGLMCSFSIFYIVAGILIKQGKLWSYFTSLVIFTAMTILYLLAFNFANIPILVIRVVVILITLRDFKDVMSLHKHNKIVKNRRSLNEHNSILDL